MNKLLPILLVVVLSGCASHTYYNLNEKSDNIELLLKDRHECVKTLEAGIGCEIYWSCLRTKGWKVDLNGKKGISIPDELSLKGCDWGTW